MHTQGGRGKFQKKEKKAVYFGEGKNYTPFILLITVHIHCPRSTCQGRDMDWSRHGYTPEKAWMETIRVLSLVERLSGT
jgi:hypothetical protein